ncbi:flippase-like domain-containing protein [bacterium]|nr:flippase-like domain-containing protein [bacterium]
MKHKRILQIVVSVALLGVLLKWIDPSGLGTALAGADWTLLGLALVLVTANRVLMAVKWNLLLAAKGIDIPWTTATRVYYTSTFLGLFLPPTVGGDVVRAYLVRRNDDRVPDIVSSILVERLLGLVALAIFGVAAAALFPLMMGQGDVDAMGLLLIAGGAAVAAGIALAFSFTATCERIVLAVTARLEGARFVGRIAKTLGKIYGSYREYRTCRGTLAIFFALTMLENAMPVVRAWIVALALGAWVPPAYFFVIVPLELVLIRIPVSFDGFGIREGLFVYFLGLVGISESLGFAVGLANHVLFLVAVLPGGLFHLLDLAARRGARPAPSPPPVS